jgi:hypothetical protein
LIAIADDVAAIITAKYLSRLEDTIEEKIERRINE